MRFEEILVIATVMTGIIAIGFRAKTSKGLVKFCYEIFPVLLIVLLLRSFVAEPFRIPSGSMKPTLEVGDFILVNKFTFGLRLPIMGTKLIEFNNPKRGDVVVFRQGGKDVIKRIVGLPGDNIKYINKNLYINNNKVTINFQRSVFDGSLLKQSQEQLGGKKHQIYIDPKKDLQRFYKFYNNVIVPDNSYFVLGDNRDNSDDSRFWGFVHDKDIIGKAFLIWLSWDKEHKNFRWERIGKAIT